MQFNDWENDPLSERSPSGSVSSRRDLEPDAGDVYASGGDDSKLSSVSRTMRDYAEGGPLVDAKVRKKKERACMSVLCTRTEELS